MAKYLDSTGLKEVLTKIKTELPSKSELEEVKKIALGSRTAVAFDTLMDIIYTFNDPSCIPGSYLAGEHLYVKDQDATTNPDMVISDDNTDFVSVDPLECYNQILAMGESDTIRIGYYELQKWTGDKIDFSGYIGVDDYASYTKYGIVKVQNGDSTIKIENGVLKGNTSGISSTTVKIGNINVGTDLSDYTAMDILKEMLCPYIAPSVSSLFLLQDGTSYSSPLNYFTGPYNFDTAKVRLSKGSEELSEEVSEVYIKVNDGEYILGTSEDSALYSFDFSSSKINFSSIESKTITIKVCFTDNKTPLEIPMTYSMILPIYYGALSTNEVAESSILAGDCKLSSPSGTIELTLGEGYKYIAIQNGKTISSIINTNTGGNCISDFANGAVSLNGNPYVIYITNDASWNTIKYKITFA